MATMYETIMNLPLFKGLSHEQVSSFLEKTHIKFSKFTDGQKIVGADDYVTDLKCILSGSIRILHKVGESRSMGIAETQSGENILGADKLFGMDNKYGVDIVAKGPVSMMQFSKEQYLAQLTPGSIYLINYLNFVSLRAQMRYDIFSSYPNGSLSAVISRLIKAYCSKKSRDIAFSFDLNDLAKFLNTDIDTATRAILQLEHKGIIRQLPDGFIIADKELLL